jgi:formiminotetrahydrofolate cyclodeaminase
MVSALTHDKKGFEAVRGEMEAMAMRSHELMRDLMRSVDSDTEAFNKLMGAFGLPKSDPALAEARKKAIQEATKGATLEPLGVLERQIPVLECAWTAARKGNPNSVSDAGVAAAMARASALGAYYNVIINLASIEDKPWREETLSKAEGLLARVLQGAGELDAFMRERLLAPLREEARA